MREHFQACLQAAGGLGLFQGRNQIGERAVVHAPAALRGRDGETNGQVCFADTGRPEKDHILSALDKAEFMQTLDLLAAQRRLEREVKSRSCLTTGSRLERIAACNRRLLRN
jgi:hypothetical protein